MRRVFLVLLLCFCAGRSLAAAALVGHWAGTQTQQGAALAVSFDFQNSHGTLSGDFNCPAQVCLQYPLDSVQHTGSRVRVVHAGDMVFDGTLVGNALTGRFQNGGAHGTFALKRAPAPALPYTVKEVRFRNGPVVLAGTLCIPPGRGRHPAILFNQGSGPETRWGTNRFWADRFARAGIAALCYDKRGCGQSTGDWKQADFNDLARDTLAGLHLLQGRPDIDPRKIGISGHSQGGFIAPLIVSLAPSIALNIAFVIAADSPGGPASEQDIFRTRTALVDDGFAPADIARAMTFFGLFLHVARTGQGWDALDAALPQARTQKWFDDVAPPPRGSWLYAYYQKTGNYNSLLLWKKVHVPVLLVYGQNDHNTPPGDSIRAIEQALAQAGNTHYAALLLPDAAHNDTLSPQPGQPFFWRHTAPGFADLQIGWVRQQIAMKN